jgi:uncharacterized SAM-binding protein YcdF (DUF218 family)
MLKSKLSHIKIFQLKYSIFFVLAFVFLGLITVQFLKIEREPMNLWSKDAPVGQCGIVLTGAPGRVREAFEYLAQKKIKKLIVSGVYRDSKLHEIFPYLPFYPEIQTDDIFLEKTSETTYGNAKQSLFMSEKLKCSDIVLMTSQIHMYRAYHIFRITFPEHIVIQKLSLPNARSESTYWNLFVEIFKSLFYYILSLV